MSRARSNHGSVVKAVVVREGGGGIFDRVVPIKGGVVRRILAPQLGRSDGGPTDIFPINNIKSISPAIIPIQPSLQKHACDSSHRAEGGSRIDKICKSRNRISGIPIGPPALDSMQGSPSTPHGTRNLPINLGRRAGSVFDHHHVPFLDVKIPVPSEVIGVIQINPPYVVVRDNVSPIAVGVQNNQRAGR